MTALWWRGALSDPITCLHTVITHLMWWNVMATSQSGWADGFNLGLTLGLCWCFSPLARPGESHFHELLQSRGSLCSLFILIFSSSSCYSLLIHHYLETRDWGWNSLSAEKKGDLIQINKLHVFCINICIISSWGSGERLTVGMKTLRKLRWPV